MQNTGKYDGDDRPMESAADDEHQMRRAEAAGFGKALLEARRLERRRIARILSSPEAAGVWATAVHLACRTGVSSRQAIGLLAVLPLNAAASHLRRASPLSALDAAMNAELKRIRPGLRFSDGRGGVTPHRAPDAGGRGEARSALDVAMADEAKRIEESRARETGAGGTAQPRKL